MGLSIGTGGIEIGAEGLMLASVATPAPPAGFIDYISVKNKTAGTLTNELVELGFPTGATELGTNNLEVYDDDGAGNKGTLLSAFQVDNTASDVNGDKRWAKLGLVIPSLTANQNRKLHVYSTATTPPTGTALTAANILDTSFDCVATFTDIEDGLDWVADVRTALAASTTWSKTGAVMQGKWREGPFLTEFKCSMPLKNGGTSHGATAGEGLRAYFHVAAYKAGSGAYNSSTNPILSVRCDVVVENGDAARTTPEHYFGSYKVEKSTSLTVATLVTATDEITETSCSFTEVEAIDTTGNTLTTNVISVDNRKVEVTRASGTWPTDILGCGFHHSSFVGTVCRRNSATSILVASKYTPTATITTGTATLTGIRFGYGGRYRNSVRVGAAENTAWLWGEHANAIVPTTKNHAQRAMDAEMTVNWARSFAQSTNDASQVVHQVTDQNGRPGIAEATDTSTSGAGNSLNYQTYESSSGGRQEIAIHPVWTVKGLINPNADGLKNIKWTTRYKGSSARLWRDYSAGGKVINIDGTTGVQYSTVGTGGGATLIKTVTTIGYGQGNLAHQADYWWINNLMYGDLFTMEHSLLTAVQDFVATDKSSESWATGRGGRSQMWADQSRAYAWRFRALGQSYTLCPDTIDADLGMLTKAQIKSQMDDVMDLMDQRFMSETGTLETKEVGFRFPKWAPHWLASGDAGGGIVWNSSSSPQFAQYQISYHGMAFGHLHEIGALDTDGLALYHWLIDPVVEGAQNANGNESYIQGYWWSFRDSGATNLYTWADFAGTVGTYYTNNWPTVDTNQEDYINLAIAALSLAKNNGFETNFTAASSLTTMKTERTNNAQSTLTQYELVDR